MKFLQNIINHFIVQCSTIESYSIHNQTKDSLNIFRIMIQKVSVQISYISFNGSYFIALKITNEKEMKNIHKCIFFK